MNNLTCVVCGAPLTGGTDTFGDIGLEMCQTDWFEMMAEWDEFVDIQNLVAREERRDALKTQFKVNRDPHE